MYDSRNTSTGICINIFVLIFVLSVRSRQVILFIWTNMFSIVVVVLIQKSVLLAVLFDSVSTGHWF